MMTPFPYLDFFRMIFTRTWRWRMSSVLCLAVLLAPTWSLGESLEEDIRALQRQSKARAAIVKEVSRSVVHIAVEKKVKQGPNPLADMFQDEFFRRFFQGPDQSPSPGPGREFTQKGLGTGVIVDAKGYILTNNHVVGGADTITVKLKDGRELKAKLVGADPGTDVAVIRIKDDNLPVAHLGDSDAMEVGESVIAVGNPFGLEQTITTGIVSAKGRSGVGVSDYEDFIQTDASINPGNSGGPLINLSGEVIGINTAIYSRSGGSMGIGFAIPVNMAKVVMKSLLETGKVMRGFLGVVIQDVTPDLAEAMGLKVSEGVLISHLGKDSPAAKAGLRQGDVIMSFGGKPTKTSGGLRYAVAATVPGTKVRTELLRNGSPMTLDVLVGNQPKDSNRPDTEDEGPAEKAEPAEKSAHILGMRLKPLGNDEAKRMGYQGQKGLLVEQVAPDSPAAEVGLRPGVMIQEANRAPVQSVADIKREIQKIGTGKKMLLLVRQGDATLYIPIRIP